MNLGTSPRRKKIQDSSTKEATDALQESSGRRRNGGRYTFLGANRTQLFNFADVEQQIISMARQVGAGHTPGAGGLDAVHVWLKPGTDLCRAERMPDLGEKCGLRFIITMYDWVDNKPGASWFHDYYRTNGYLDHVRQIVMRFRGHPAVLMWEMMNEPNPCATSDQGDCVSKMIDNWAKDTSAFIRSMDACRPNSAETIGSLGFSNRSWNQFVRLHDETQVEIVSIHRHGDSWFDCGPGHERYACDIQLADRYPVFFGEIWVRIYEGPHDCGEGKKIRSVDQRSRLIWEDLEGGQGGHNAWDSDVDGYMLWSYASSVCLEDYPPGDPAWDMLRASKLNFRYSLSWKW